MRYSDPLQSFLEAFALIKLPLRLLWKARVTLLDHLVPQFILCLSAVSRAHIHAYAHKVLEKHPEMNCLSCPPVSGPVCIDETKGAAAADHQQTKGTHRAGDYQWKMTLRWCRAAPPGDKGDYITGDKSDHRYTLNDCVCFSAGQPIWWHFVRR